MKFYYTLFLVLILVSTASAECRDKDCMTDEFEFKEEGNLQHTFYYNSVFQVGSNWYIIFDYPSGKSNDSISFEFSTGQSKLHIYDSSKETDSVSFSGSTFSEENFNLKLFVNITGTEGSDGEFVLNIYVNKPPSEDMFFLWGGMTVFWASIGAYVIYLSKKINDLDTKLGLVEDGEREKN